jgi:ceramide glucosyltransferase
MTCHILEIVAVLGTVASMAYYTLCLWSAAGFLHKRKAGEPAPSEVEGGARATPPTAPPVSILKPLKGTDPAMYASLRSQCLQDYAGYEIIFGVSDSNDPAAEIATRLRSEFPQRAIHLVVCDRALGTNAKVSNLAQMLTKAQHQHLVVSDSDIRVQRDYLRRVMAPLADPRVGLVTCLYHGVPGSTLGSRLESLGISTDFAAGVLAARQLEGGIRFGLGSTLAFRRRDLEAIGGFEAFADYLADDYQIGKSLADRGLKVELSDVVVETFLPSYNWREFAAHQLRWARGVRDSRRWGYLGLVVTFGLPWAVLALLLSRGALWAWGLLAAAACLRAAIAIAVGWSVLRDRQVFRLLALLPLRDLVALLVWIGSLAGHTVVWRGDSFTLKDGRLVRIDS